MSRPTCFIKSAQKFAEEDLKCYDDPSPTDELKLPDSYLCIITCPADESLNKYRVITCKNKNLSLDAINMSRVGHAHTMVIKHEFHLHNAPKIAKIFHETMKYASKTGPTLGCDGVSRNPEKRADYCLPIDALLFFVSQQCQIQSEFIDAINNKILAARTFEVA